ncbi:MAG: bifunctional [glutamate--ammonia ligase]-adenylyl-L-tyrosine phosphorylase/[glutamate--ammonia-ligase] adenylyltransferase [Candidatus Abyssubacteria bacterium]
MFGNEELAEIFFTERVPFERVRSVLFEVGIKDAVRASKNIRLLAGHNRSRAVFLRVLPEALAQLREVADPDMALNNWERLVDVTRDRERHFANLHVNPLTLRVLLKLLGASQYLADILIRRPHLFEHTIANGLWRDPVDSISLQASLDRRLAETSDHDSMLAALREFKQVQMLGVGARDICGLADVEQILRETSLLADVCVRAAFEIAQTEVRKRFGTPMTSEDGASLEATGVVLALGKLGGEELNYSSDIDLMFIYSHDGETLPSAASDRIESVTNNQYFAKLAERFIDVLARVTEEGRLYRVDMRLRPMGSKGPLVSSLESHLNYYEIFGETWERQALLKARPVAGDMQLGLRFLKEIRPFVYPRYLDYRGIREIQDLKIRIEREVDKRGHTQTEVKLGRGGIRDIEFTVQFLQLLNGGKHPELRGTNTLAVLHTLEKTGYLSPAECAALVHAYKFLRRLENRLQIMQDRQLHVLPSRNEDFEVVARSLGYRSGNGRAASEELATEYRRHTEKVRELFNKFFGKMFAGAGRASPVVDLIQNPEPAPDEIDETLGRYGFKDPARAYENLRQLAEGPTSASYPARTRNFFCSIAPVLVQHLQQSPDPDMALNNLQRCIAALGAEMTFYEILASNPKSIELFVALSSYSDHLIRLFVNDPGVIDFLIGTRMLEEESSLAHINKALGRFLEINPNFYESVQRFKNGELLRVGLRDILGLADIAEVTRELSSVAEAMLSWVYRKCLAEHTSRYGEPVAGDGSPASMSILGMGKLGGREINYASDLDVVFVYSSDGQTTGGKSEPVSCQQFFVTLAAQVVKKLGEVNPYGYLYKVDTRLRPDGEQGMLAVSADSFISYHREKSALWEKRAMTKLRPVAGDMQLGERLREFVHSVIYAPTFFSRDLVRDAVELLGKIFEAERAQEREGVQIKHAQGGIIEIEFLVQLLQLKHGPTSERLRITNTLEALEALFEAGHLPRHYRDDLTAGLVLLRRVENRLRLMHNRSLSELPTDPESLDKLALRLGTTAAADRRPGEALLDMLETYISRTHRAFEEQVRELLEE